MNRKYFTIIFLSLILAFFFSSSVYASEYFDTMPDNIICQDYVYVPGRVFNTKIYYLPNESNSGIIGLDMNPAFYAIRVDDEELNGVIHNKYLVIMKTDASGTYTIDCDVCINFPSYKDVRRHSEQPSINSYSDNDLKVLTSQNSEIKGFYVYNPEFHSSVKIFESYNDFSVFVENGGLESPSQPDNPPEETGNPKVTFSNGDYCIFNTNNSNIAGCLNSDPGQVYSNGLTHDLELFEIFYNDDFTVVSDKEYSIDCSFYDSEDNFLYDYPVNCKRLNSYATYEYTRPFLVTWDTIVTPCITVNKQCSYENFKFVAPNHNDLFLYLIGDGEAVNWPLNPNHPDPDLPGEDIVDPDLPVIPEEWGFIGDLFNNFIGAGNKLLGSIFDKLSSTYKSINNGFSKVNGFLSDIKNNISDKINSFNASVTEQITNFKDTFISSISGFKESVLTAIGTLASDIGDSVSVGFSDVLIELLVPSENYFSDKFTALRQNFTFIDSIVNSGQIIIDRLKNISGNTSPTITIDLSNKISGASYGSQIVVINFDWYTPYKKSVDILISSIIWVSYIFLLYKRAPEIIRGSGMITSIFGGSNHVN